MHPLKTFALTIAALTAISTSHATPEPKYTVEQESDNIQIRTYAPVMVAEVTTTDGQNNAFRLLFNYITGENTQKESIAMTAPVLQEKQGPQKAGVKIPMTAPVLQTPEEAGERMTFFLPATFTSQNTPKPVNPQVSIRQLPAQKIAAIQFSGYMRDAKVKKYTAKLQDYLSTNNISAQGTAFTAGYNAPWTPWFMRRNEVMYRLK